MSSIEERLAALERRDAVRHADDSLESRVARLETIRAQLMDNADKQQAQVLDHEDYIQDLGSKVEFLLGHDKESRKALGKYRFSVHDSPLDERGYPNVKYTVADALDDHGQRISSLEVETSQLEKHKASATAIAKAQGELLTLHERVERLLERMIGVENGRDWQSARLTMAYKRIEALEEEVAMLRDRDEAQMRRSEGLEYAVVNHDRRINALENANAG